LTETAAPVVAKWTWETTTRSSLLADDRSRGRDKAGKLWLPSTFPKVNLDFPDESYEVRLLTNCREPFSAPPEIKDLSEVSRESGIQNKDIMAALREAILNPYSQSRNATQSQYSIKKINSHQERCEEVVLCRQLAF
ncbi:MAG: hypothetical protein JWM11_6884, partial [Planctomycetaceae bacterium]|nr:hypothetical protein [Planctomycetaceae bacterium]